MKSFESISARTLPGLREIWRADKASVSVVVPAYNEAVMLKKNLDRLYAYMETLDEQYEWEIVVVNDGSTDRTGELAEEFARTHRNFQVLHHNTNQRLGRALCSAFAHCEGDYVVTMDVDLSYAPEHIGQLLNALCDSGAKIAIASPYMNGGKVSNVPWLRRVMSRWANRFLSFTANGTLHTLTGMVRAYDRRFLDALDLNSTDSEINTEILYKAQLLRARIVEIPAHLDWSLQRTEGKERKSSLKISHTLASYLFSGFIFRPVMFFILSGLALMLLAMYPLTWAGIHTVEQLQNVPLSVGAFDHRLSAAIAAAFREYPHTFFVTGIVMMLGIQLMSLGILAMQNKRYFEEMFHLGTTIYRFDRTNGNAH